jgi:hypothetical protein
VNPYATIEKETFSRPGKSKKKQRVLLLSRAKTMVLVEYIRSAPLMHIIVN